MPFLCLKLLSTGLNLKTCEWLGDLALALAAIIDMNKTNVLEF